MTRPEANRIKLLDKNLLDALCHEAAGLPRRRKNYNLHQSSQDPVQKIFNALQKDSYVRPHRHPQQEKTELLMAVRGAFGAFIFDEQGMLTERFDFSAGGEVFGTEIKPNTWHTVVALEDDSVLFELKQGPYIPLADKDFASWAPEENTADVAGFVSWLQQARPGEKLSLL